MQQMSSAQIVSATAMQHAKSMPIPGVRQIIQKYFCYASYKISFRFRSHIPRPTTEEEASGHPSSPEYKSKWIPRRRILETFSAGF